MTKIQVETARTPINADVLGGIIRNEYIRELCFTIEIEQVGRAFKYIFEYIETGNEHRDKEDRMCFLIFKHEVDRVLRSIKFGRFHPAWMGGVSTENHKIRNCAAYRDWRTAVFERDNYTCLDCGERGGRLNAHHILRFSTHKEERFKIDNGETLCQACHWKRHSRRG